MLQLCSATAALAAEQQRTAALLKILAYGFPVNSFADIGNVNRSTAAFQLLLGNVCKLKAHAR
jgi:hypothetical protein